MDYSFFDILIDSAFVINSDREILYCNEPAAGLCEASVRRLTNKGKKIYDVIQFEDKELFLMPDGSKGQQDTFPLSEMKYELPSGKDGKLQLSIQPFSNMENEERWAIIIREVSLEEMLHAKNQERLKQLEEYSKNLEKMVAERTAALAQANGMLNAIMDSLGQGFLTFNEEGICSNIYTKACEEVLEAIPGGQLISDVLKINQNELETFNMWKMAIFSEQLPFDSLKSLGPDLFKHSDGKYVTLDFYPIRGENEKIDNIVLVATDRTSERQANLALEKEKKFAQMVIKLITSKKQFTQFLESTKEIIDNTKELALCDKGAEFDYQQSFRLLHTLEGEAATYSVAEVWEASREAQEIIEPLRQGLEVNAEDVLVKFSDSLNSLEEAFGKFKIENEKLFKMVGIGSAGTIEISKIEILSLIQYLHSQGVQEFALNEISDTLLKESLAKNFNHFNDVAKLVADKQGKMVAPIEFSGDVKVYIDKYKNLISSFVHAFRNAVDHGLEPVEERQMMGKADEGHIKVAFKLEEKEAGNWVSIHIQDDGQGVNPEVIRKKLDERKDIQDVESLSDEEVIQFIFDSGLTSRDEVGEFSGRGVGLNAVKEEAEKLGGQAWVESTLGQGTLLKVLIPDFSPELTLKASA